MNEGELEIMTGLRHLSEFFARNCDGNQNFKPRQNQFIIWKTGENNRSFFVVLFLVCLCAFLCVLHNK